VNVTIKYRGDQGESALELAPGRSLVIGRDQSCDLVIPHSEVSRRHLRLTAGPAAVVAEDLQSSNGSYRDSRRFQRAELTDSASLRLGETGPEIRVEIAHPQPETAGRAPIDTTSKYSREQLGAQLDRGRDESRSTPGRGPTGAPPPPPAVDPRHSTDPRVPAAFDEPAGPRSRPSAADVSATRLYFNEEAAIPPSRPDQTQLYEAESVRPRPDPRPAPPSPAPAPPDHPGAPKAPASTRMLDPEQLGVRPAPVPPPAGRRPPAAHPPPSSRPPVAAPPTPHPPEPPAAGKSRAAAGEVALRRQIDRLRTLLFVIAAAGLVLLIGIGAAIYRLQDRAQVALARIDRMDGQLSELLKWLNDQKKEARGEISGALQASKDEFQRQFDLELQATRAEFEQRVASMRQEFESARANIERDLGGVKSLRETAQAEAQAGTAARASAQEASASVVLIYTSYVLANGDEVPQWQTASGFYLGNRTRLITTKAAVQPWKFLDPDMLATVQTGGYKIQEARTNIALLRSGSSLTKAAGGDELDPQRLALSSQRGKVKLVYVPRDDWSSATGESSDGDRVTVQVHRVDSPLNFAVLEVASDAAGPPLPVRTTSLVGALGAKFTVLGFPGGITGGRAEASPDVVSLRQRDKGFELDKTIGHPQLGSPVLDPNGRVVAMAVSGKSCIAIEQILPYVSR